MMLKGDTNDLIYSDSKCWVYFIDSEEDKQEPCYQIYSLEKWLYLYPSLLDRLEEESLELEKIVKSFWYCAKLQGMNCQVEGLYQ